ncbi:N/A [soil metagenome]
MRVLHVLSGLEKGGGERVAVELANITSENNHTVSMIAGWPEDPSLLQHRLSEKIQLRFISSHKNTAYSKTIFWVFKNRNWICSHDIIHCHLTYGAVFGSVVRILLKFILRKKIPVILETNHAVGMAPSKFKRWIHTRLILQMDGMVLMATDPFWLTFINNHKHIKTTVIPNGIDLINKTEDLRKNEKLLSIYNIPDDHSYLIGSISLLRPERKAWQYVLIFKEVLDKLGKNIHFLLAGSGDEQERIENLIKENALENNFHLIGLISEPAAFLSGLDMYVSIAVGATAGISMIEAAMCKLPVVAVQLDDQYKRKDEDWIWADADLSKVAEKIISLLTNQDECFAYRENQYNYVINNFTNDVMFRSYEKFYKELL